MHSGSSQRKPDGDLRRLSNADLVALIKEDIRKLDRSIAEQRRTKQNLANTSRKNAAQMERMESAVEESVADCMEQPILHAVTCCNHTMGDFIPAARVRCPFCATWHHAADFPANG